MKYIAFDAKTGEEVFEFEATKSNVEIYDEARRLHAKRDRCDCSPSKYEFGGTWQTTRILWCGDGRHSLSVALLIIHPEGSERVVISRTTKEAPR